MGIIMRIYLSSPSGIVPYLYSCLANAGYSYRCESRLRGKLLLLLERPLDSTIRQCLAWLDRSAPS